MSASKPIWNTEAADISLEGAGYADWEKVSPSPAVLGFESNLVATIVSLASASRSSV